MAISLRSGGTASYYSLSAPITVTLPGACQPLDVAIICGTGWNGVFNAQAGWSQILSNYTLTAGYMSVWYRVIQSGDTTWSFGTTFMTAISLVFVAFVGVDRSNPIAVIGTQNIASLATSIVANSINIPVGGAYWLNATCGVQKGSAPQFSAAGFTEYDNSAASGTNYPAGLLWQGGMQSGPTGVATISASGGTSSNQSLANCPFALTLSPVVSLSMPAVNTTLAPGVTTRTMLAVAPHASASAQIGVQTDRQLETLGRRTLENNSVRLLEGPVDVAAVTIRANLLSPSIIGYVGTISIPVAPTVIPISAVIISGYAPATSILELINVTASTATGYVLDAGIPKQFPVSAVSAVGYIASTMESDRINAVAVAVIGYASASSLTIGGGVYIAGAAVAGTGYTPQPNVTELLGVAATNATGYVSILSLVIGGSIQLSAFAVVATGLAGTETVDMAVSPDVVSVSGTMASVIAGLNAVTGAVGITLLAGMSTITAGMQQEASGSAAFSIGAPVACLAMAPGIVSASGFTGIAGPYPSLVQNAVGCTAQAGSVVDTIAANQLAVSSIWFPAAAAAIQIFNVSAPAVDAGASAGIMHVVIGVNSPAAFSTELIGIAIAIPAPPLNVGSRITVRMPIDQFGGPRVNTLSTEDAFGNPDIVVVMLADEFGSPHLTVATGN